MIEETGVYLDAADVADVRLADDIVLVLAVSGSSSSSVYHTQACDRLPDRMKTVDRETMETWGRVECQFCQADGTTPEVIR
jgi:hypothetical protein